MPSKLLLRLMKLSNDVRAFATTNAARVSKSTSEAIAHGAPKGTKIPAVDSVIALLSDAVERSVTAAERADESVDAESADVGPAIASRDNNAATLRAKIVRLRDAVRVSSSAASVRKLGFVGDTPTDPDALVSVTKTVLAALESDPPKPAEDDGVKVDLKKLTKGVAELAHALEADISRVRTEAREVQAARVDRDAKTAVAERQLRGLAMVLEGLCVFIGDDALAERVRPATRARADEEDEEPAPPPAG